MNEPRPVDEQSERYRFALEAAGVGVWDWDVRSGVVWWSDNLTAVHGIDAARFDGTFAGFLGLVHDDDRQRVSQAIEEAIRAGAGYEIEFRVVGDDGNVRWIGGKGRVFRDAAGEPLRMIGAGADMTARHRAAERERLLADAGDLLASSLDIEATLTEVARLAVPRLADWCVVDLLEDDGVLHRLQIVHRDPELAATAEDLKRRYPSLSPTDPHTIWQVLRTGRSRIDPVIDDGRLVAMARDPNHFALLRRLGFAAELVVPLVARGRPLGAMTFVLASPDRRYAPDDQTLAEGLAGRCALALDNARLYQAARLAEVSAQASEARYRAIVETTNEGVWLVSADARTRYANDRMAQLLGTNAADLSESGVLDFVYPEDVPAARERLDRNLGGQTEQFDFRFRRADGGEVLVLACTSPMRGADGDVVGALGMFTDVTERQRAEQALHVLAAASGDLAESLDLRATLANVVRSVVPSLADWCVLDLQTASGFERVAVVHCDPTLAEVAEQVRRDYPPDPTAPGGVGFVLRTGMPAFYPVLTEEISLATARNDPEMLTLLRTLGMESYIVVPLLAGEQNLGALSLIHGHSGRRHDAHDFAVAEELARRAATAVDNARLHAQAQAAVLQRDEFLAIAAHDLKSPLTVIQGRAQALRRRLARQDDIDLERFDAGLADVQVTATRMARLIDELQDLAVDQADRAPNLLRRPTDLVTLVRDEVALLAPTTTGHHLQVLTAEDELVVEVDGHRLARALANLLGNAIKYSPDGGDVVVEVGHDETGTATIAVRDHGLGIPADDLPRIFERYYRGANVAGRLSGTGIGLAGVKQIVEQHGGRVEVVSETGRGSCFTLRLPTIPQPSPGLVDAAVVEPVHPAAGPIEPVEPGQAENPGKPGANA